ncbi:cell division protein FtsI (penicillin-binding protein 3) [Chitinophaga costaii]|uniref:Cell division protein FtsI (Penicillin-binding protein 3) n=1 Tax=Chitinophaga costaii TaxID=1335309 RepID=A0A1C4BU47_9BACT|nr:penicillin-binding protein [Chitinophaga costaii]PUZ27469.1 PASTA domain-containing protein [Chitinophaga costaii]SCC10405.1 cell division protein FtsI (penicillin-binding protein 3) [Chitinophaga costaii]
MEIKKDILWRVYVCFIGMLLFGVAILVKVFYIQQVEGPKWRSMSDSLHTRYVPIDADRGTIYSEDGSMLSTSIPYFDIRVDFAADGLRDKDGKIFKENVDSLAWSMAHLFGDRNAAEYKKLFYQGYKSMDRYFLLKRDIDFKQYLALRDFPMFRLGKNKGGMIAEPKNKRINPFRLLANRTIGLARENAQSVGLERTYDASLKGAAGKRLMRRISGGAYIPVDGSDIDPENGKDIITTLDVNIQDIAESALMNILTENEAQYGTCIVMEVKTGKIKAIANLGRQEDGSYYEDMNYALQVTEPGSTFKLATVISAFEDKYATMDDMVDINNGRWQFGKRTIFDSEPHPGITNVTIKHAFEISSNVGLAKVAYTFYKDHPNDFVKHLRRLHLDQPTGIDLLGEGQPVIKNTSSRTWSASTLPWMGFGYEVLISPLQTCMLYNAVANGGKMMKPYLVSAVQEYGQPIKTFEPAVVMDSICSSSTLRQVKKMLEGVIMNGTAKALWTPNYNFAGKTGTALMANGSHGYAEKIYQSSFAGYFPANHPLYTCVVVIRNKPHATKFYGGSVAGPVFREVADRLFAMNAEKERTPRKGIALDTALAMKTARTTTWKTIIETLELPMNDADMPGIKWVSAKVDTSHKVQFEPVSNEAGEVPDVVGMGLKDALYLLENAGLKVVVRGTGKVKKQSLPAGMSRSNEQTIVIELS